MHDDSSIDAFSDDSDVILDSNQVDVEPIEQHKLDGGFQGGWVFKADILVSAQNYVAWVKQQIVKTCKIITDNGQ